MEPLKRYVGNLYILLGLVVHHGIYDLYLHKFPFLPHFLNTFFCILS